MRQAVVLLLQRQDQVLAVSRGLHRPFTMGLPGGKVEPGETLMEAVCREAREEAGIEVYSPYPIWERTCHGPTDFHTTVFKCKGFGGGIKLFSHEGWIRWTGWDAICRGPFGEYNKHLRNYVCQSSK